MRGGVVAKLANFRGNFAFESQILRHSGLETRVSLILLCFAKIEFVQQVVVFHCKCKILKKEKKTMNGQKRRKKGEKRIKQK
jgi:hypothetical protein